MTRPPNWIEQQVPIAPGMDESVDPRLLPIGTPRYLENVRVRREGRIEKRPGYSNISGASVSGLPASAAALWASEWNTLAAVGAESNINSQVAKNVYVRDSSAVWNYAGRHGFVVPERRVGVTMDGSAAIRGCSCVAVGGIVFVAWWQSTAPELQVRAMDPAGVVLRETTLSGMASPRLVYADSVLYLVYTEGNDVKVRTVATATLALGSATTIGTKTANGRFDAAAVDGGTTWIIAYPDSATTIRVRVMSAATSSADTTITTTSEAEFIAVAAISGGKVVVTYVDGTEAEVSTFASDLTGANNVTVHTAAGNEDWTVQSGVVRTGTNEWAVVYGGSDSSASPVVNVNMLYHARIDDNGDVTAGTFKVYRFAPCSKPFVTGASGSRRVSIVAHDALTSGQSLQSSNHILDLETRSVPGSGAELAAITYEHQPKISTAIRQESPEVASLGSGRFAVPVRWQDPNDITAMDLLVFRSALASEAMTWAGRSTKEVSGALLISGGALYEHCAGAFTTDRYVVESGFANDPLINTAAAAGGSLTSGTEYSYVACYVWMDPLGTRVHRSAPSAVDTVTPSAGNLTVTVRIATLGCSGRFGTASGSVVAEVYRSWNGGPYYYCGDTSSVLPTALSVTYTDSDSDATVEANRTLYTDSGVLANEPPSGARLVAENGSRVFTVGWKERVVECSKLIIPSAPVEFCDADEFRIPYSEPLTAIECMDGALVAWSKRSIFVVTGDGPNDQGVGSYSEPRRIPATVGSDFPHVVENQDGLLFMGGGTIWLLPRGFGPPIEIGAKIQTTLASYPYLRAAVRCVNEDDDCCHFLLASSDTSSAVTRVAVWNNQTRGWSIDTDGGMETAGAAASVGGNFTYVRSTWTSISSQDPVRQLDPDLVGDDDDGTRIIGRVVFGDWRPFGPLGWGKMSRLQVHGETAGQCTVNLVTVVDGVTGTASRTVSGGQFYLEHAPKPAAGGAFQFELYDTPAPSPVNRGMALHGLAFHAEQEPGLRRLSNSERF